MAYVHVLILCGMVSGTLCANFKPLSQMNMEDTINSMQQKMDTMEEKILSLESKEREDLPQKIKDEISVIVRAAVERFHEERSKHATNIEDIHMDSRHERNKRSVTLEELHQRTKEHEDNVDKRLSDVEKALEELSGRFDSDKNRFLIMDNHLLLKLQEVQEKTIDALEKIQSVEDEVKRALERDRLNIKSLEVKENLTRILITSHIELQRDVEEVFRQEITSSAETLMMHINESSLDFKNIESNFTKSIRSIQNSLSEIEKDKGNTNIVSKLDEELKKLDKVTKSELQSIQAEIYPRMKKLEECCQMCDNVAVLNKTLKNHTSEIGALTRQVLEYQNCNTEDLKDYDGLYVSGSTMIEHLKSLEIKCKEGYNISPLSAFPFCNNGTWKVSENICMKGTCDSEPPTLRNGKANNFERQNGSHVQYECDRNLLMFRNSTVHCNSGKWEGHPPVCSVFDTTFYLEANRYPEPYIKCYSDVNSTKIEILKLPDTVTYGKLSTGIRRSYGKSEEISFPSTLSMNGIFKCRFRNDDRSTEIVFPLQNSATLYFVDQFKASNVGDTVELEMPSTRTYIKWKHNGVSVPSWDGKTKVVISDVKTTDGGVYEGYFANHSRASHSFDIGFLKLTVRKCKANMYGEHCDQKCPACYNGGVCHDILGICICPDGFIGNNCEKTCPQGYHGADCSVACRRDNCMYGMHCKPDPYGCFCARGYYGNLCMIECIKGTYGAGCTQTCHCFYGSDSCNRFTGACTGGCSAGWSGDTCQIPAGT